MIYEVDVEGRSHQVSVKRADGGGWLVQVDDGPEEHIAGTQVDRAEWVVELDRRRRSVGCFVDGDHASVQVAGHAVRATVVDPRSRGVGLEAGAAEGEISTPMPGVIVRLGAAQGATVKAGDVVVVVEAMKMENEYKSPIDGVVAKIHVEPGQAVEANTVLVSVEPAE